jgi:hypothetical protein
MKEILLKRPIDPDTRIISCKYAKIGNYDVLIEEWSWEEVKASSVVFLESQIGELHDLQIMQLVRNHFNTDERMTISRDEVGYAFVSYRFKT